MAVLGLFVVFNWEKMAFWPFSGHFSLNCAFLHFHEKFNAPKVKQDRWLKFGRDGLLRVLYKRKDRFMDNTFHFCIIQVFVLKIAQNPCFLAILGEFSDKNMYNPKTKANILKSILAFVEHPKETISTKFQPSIMFSLERIKFFVKV